MAAPPRRGTRIVGERVALTRTPGGRWRVGEAGGGSVPVDVSRETGDAAQGAVSKGVRQQPSLTASRDRVVRYATHLTPAQPGRVFHVKPMRPREELSITAPRPTASRPGSRPAATRIVWLHRGGTVAARWVSPLTDRPPEVRSGTRARVLPPCRAHSQRVDHSRSVAWGSGASAPRPRHRLLVRMAGTHAVSRETAKQLPTEPALLGPLFGTDGAMLGSPRAGGPSLTWDPYRAMGHRGPHTVLSAAPAHLSAVDWHPAAGLQAQAHKAVIRAKFRSANSCAIALKRPTALAPPSPGGEIGRAPMPHDQQSADQVIPEPRDATQGPPGFDQTSREWGRWAV